MSRMQASRSTTTPTNVSTFDNQPICNPAYTQYCRGSPQNITSSEGDWYPAEFYAKLQADYGSTINANTNSSVNLYLKWYNDPAFTQSCNAEIKVSTDGTTWTSLGTVLPQNKLDIWTAEANIAITQNFRYIRFET